jgi:hypothetical protein
VRGARTQKYEQKSVINKKCVQLVNPPTGIAATIMAAYDCSDASAHVVKLHTSCVQIARNRDSIINYYSSYFSLLLIQVIIYFCLTMESGCPSLPTGRDMYVSSSLRSPVKQCAG